MKLVNIVGARPQFIKLAPLERAIADVNTGDTRPVESIIIHTGQHYDTGLSDIFFDELKIPRADFHLDVGSGRKARDIHDGPVRHPIHGKRHPVLGL